MVAPRLFLCLALLLPAAISRADDSTNTTPPAPSQKSPADIEGSPEWVQKKLAQGKLEDVVDLGVKYAAGDGVSQDGKKAVRLFVCAATWGDVRAECCLGIAFANGIGASPKNGLKARDWLEAAAREDYAEAQSNLGRSLWTGEDGLTNYAQAYEWIARAAAHGLPEAEANLGIMYHDGIGVEQDMVESLKWFQLSFAARPKDKDAIAYRDEAASRLNQAEKDVAKHRVRSFRPNTNNAIIADEAKAVTCPLGNFFQIPVEILGKTNSMVVDTGASCAVLDVGFQDHLGEPLASLPGSTLSSSAAIFEYYDCPEFFIGERRFAPLLAVIEDFKKLQQASGEPLYGVFGMSCLKYEVLCFDSDHDSFSIGGSVPETVKKTALAVPLQRHDSFNYGINVSMNGRGPIFLAMDSGFDGSVALNESDWRKVFAGKFVKSRPRQTVDAEGKIGDSRRAHLQSLAIGTNRYNNLIAESLANSEIPSRFGQEFIRRHLCYIDFPNLMLYLLPGQDFNRPDEDDMSGLSFMKIDGKITAYSVDKDSPAYQAGIRANDQILSLNGQDTASLHLKSIRDTLKTKPGDEIKMLVKHGTQTNSVQFRLKRLL